MEGRLDSALVSCVRHFTLFEGAVPNFFVMFILILTDSDSTDPEAAVCWMANV